jgi:cardiolipin synthase
MKIRSDLQNSWTNIEILSTGDRYFSELLTGFRHAKLHIQVEVYILNIDSVTRLLLEELVKARERGVRVQILVDGFGSYTSIPDLMGYCARHDIEFRVYQPFPFSSMGSRRMIWAYWLSMFRLLRKLNRRNHRKVVLIDHDTAFVGSMNWTQVHSRRALSNLAWRDTSVKVQGPPVTILHHVYQVDWYRARKIGFKRFRKKPPLLKNYDPRKSVVRLNTGLKERWRLHRDTLKRIRHAKKRILLTTAYFLPHRSLVRALKKAAQRGVSVQIIVPGPSDVPLIKWAAFELAYSLLQDGVQIYEYQNSILHSKVMIIDDWVTVGSTNLNYRSVFHDLEVEVVLNDPESIHTMEQLWLQDQANSREFNIEDYRSASWLRRFVSRLAFRLRYLL